MLYIHKVYTQKFLIRCFFSIHVFIKKLRFLGIYDIFHKKKEGKIFLLCIYGKVLDPYKSFFLKFP